MGQTFEIQNKYLKYRMNIHIYRTNIQHIE